MLHCSHFSFSLAPVRRRLEFQNVCMILRGQSYVSCKKMVKELSGRRARHTNTIRHKRHGLCITTKTLSPQKDNMQAFLDGQTPSRNRFETSPWPSSEHVARARESYAACSREPLRAHEYVDWEAWYRRTAAVPAALQLRCQKAKRVHVLGITRDWDHTSYQFLTILQVSLGMRCSLYQVLLTEATALGRQR